MALDRVDRLSPGTGRLDLFGFGEGDFDVGRAGIGLDYEHRIRESISTWAHGDVGRSWGVKSEFSWQALAGLRMRF